MHEQAAKTFEEYERQIDACWDARAVSVAPIVAAYRPVERQYSAWYRQRERMVFPPYQYPEAFRRYERQFGEATFGAVDEIVPILAECLNQPLVAGAEHPKVDNAAYDFMVRAKVFDELLPDTEGAVARHNNRNHLDTTDSQSIDVGEASEKDMSVDDFYGLRPQEQQAFAKRVVAASGRSPACWGRTLDGVTWDDVVGVAQGAMQKHSRFYGLASIPFPASDYVFMAYDLEYSCSRVKSLPGPPSR